MEKWQKQFILQNVCSLLDKTRCNEELFSVLESNGILARVDLDILRARKSSEGEIAQVRLLYDMLETRLNAYNVFLRALYQTRQVGAAKILEQGFLHHNIINPMETLKIPGSLDCLQDKESLCWPDLSSETQEKLLQRMIRFQGHTDSIAYILYGESKEKNMANILNDIMSKDIILMLSQQSSAPLEVAMDTIPRTLDYFIERHLSYRSNIMVDVLKAPSTDVFVITGVTRTHLTELASPHRTDISSTQVDRVTVRFILLEHEKDFETICKNCESNIHLLTLTGEKFRWERTKGHVTLLQQYIHQQQDVVSEVDFVAILSDKQKPVCISDTPGMGKTVLLASIARNLHTRHPNQMSFFFALPQFIHQLSKSYSKVTADTVRQHIASSGASNHFGVKLLSYRLKAPSEHFDIFLDGYDEVIPAEFPVVRKVLRVLRNEFPNTRVFVTTRPHLRNELENLLGVLGFNISPFHEQEQVRFLVKYWECCIDIKPSGREKVGKFASSCLHTLKSNMVDSEQDIAGVPLQCMLLADIYLEKVIRYVECEDELSSGTLATSLFKMYEQLVNLRFKRAEDEEYRQEYGTYRVKKFYNYWTGKRKWKRRVIDYHILASLKLLFPEHVQTFREMLLGTSSFNSETHICTIGLLEEKYFDDPQPKFLHRTFAEYLFAEFAAEMLLKGSPLRPYYKMQELLVEILIKSVLTSTVHEESPFSNEYFIPPFNIHASKFENPVIAYFLDSHLKKYELKEIDLSIIPKYFQVRHPGADIRIKDLMLSCLTSNYGGLLEYLSQLYPVRSKHIENLFKVASKYSSAEVMAKLLFILKVRNYRIRDLGTEEVTALHISVERGDYSVFETLMTDCYKFVKSTNTLLHHCVKFSFENSDNIITQKHHIIDIILAKNKDLLNSVSSLDESTPILQPNIHKKLLKYLIFKGANVNAITSSNDTVLHKILEPLDRKTTIDLEDYLDVMTLLSKKKFCQWNRPNFSCKTSLSMLLEQMDINESILQIYRNGKYLFNVIDENHENLLFTAIRHNRSLSTIQLLLEYGVRCSHVNINHQNLIHVSAEIGHPTILEWLLVTKKIPVDSPDNEGNTPLHLAIRYNSPAHQHAITILLENGANVNSVNKRGNIPLLEGLEHGQGLTVGETLLRKMIDHGMVLTKEFASRALYFLMMNNKIKQCEVNDDYESLYKYLTEQGAELYLKDRTSPWRSKEIQQSIIDLIESLPFSNRKSIFRNLGFRKSLDMADQLIQIPFQKFCNTLLVLENKLYFQSVRNMLHSTESSGIRFNTAPSSVISFLETPYEQLLVVRTSHANILIARIHETVSSSIPLVDLECLPIFQTDSVLKSTIILVRGYDKRVIEFLKHKRCKLICITSSNVEATGAKIVKDGIRWDDLSFSFQQKLLKSPVRLSPPACESLNAVKKLENDLLLQAIILSYKSTEFYSSKFVLHHVLPLFHENSNLNRNICIKLVCIAIRSLFPAFKNIVLTFESELGNVDLDELVKSYILIRQGNDDFSFAAESTASYFLSLAIGEITSNTIKVCNEVLEVLLQIMSSKVQTIMATETLKQSNMMFYRRDIVHFLNNHSEIENNFSINRPSVDELAGYQNIKLIIKFLLFTHTLPYFANLLSLNSDENYLDIENFIVKYSEKLCSLNKMDSTDSKSSKLKHLSDVTIIKKAAQYGSFFIINYILRWQTGLFKYLKHAELQEIFHSCVKETSTEDVELIVARIHFINLLLSKCKTLKKINSILSNSLHCNKIHWKLIAFLIANGADPFDSDDKKQTIAHKVPAYLSPADFHLIVEFLISHGYSNIFRVENCMSETCVEIALKTLKIQGKTLEALLQSNSVSPCLLSDKKYSLLHCAVAGRQNRDILQIILEYLPGKQLYELALHDAVEFGNTEAVKYFLELGADVNETDFSGKTPLHYSLLYGNGAFEIVELLISNGANVNKKDRDEHTPLWYGLNGKGQVEKSTLEYLQNICATI